MSAPVSSAGLMASEHPLVVARHDLDELVDAVVPVGEDAAGDVGAGVVAVAEDRADEPGGVEVVERFEVDHLGVQAGGERPVRVEDVGDAARHAGAEVPAGRAEHDHPATGHVLTAVVADALDHRGRTGVADAEPLADHAAEERLAGGRAVEGDVAGDDVVLGHEVGMDLAPAVAARAVRRTGPCRRSRWRRRTAAA